MDVPDFQMKPPWYSVPVEVRVTELTFNKVSYPVAMLKNIADKTITQVRDDFREAAMFYTDGTLHPDMGRAGASFHLPEEAARRHIRVIPSSPLSSKR